MVLQVSIILSFKSVKSVESMAFFFSTPCGGASSLPQGDESSIINGKNWLFPQNEIVDAEPKFQ
jgi:hypothetical protein